MSFNLAAFKEMYANGFGDHVLIDLKVSDGAGGYVTHSDIRAFVMGYKPDELIDGGPIQVNDTKCIILGDDLPNGLRRLERKDRVVLQSDGKSYSVERWDDKTRRVGANLIAIEAQLRG